MRGYPTLKFFKKGKPVEYGGGRTAETIVSWVEKKTGPPAKALAGADDAKAFVEGKNVAVIGCFSDETTDGAKAFLGAASSMDDIPFGITGDEAVCSEHGVSGEGVVVVKTFDDGKAIMTEEVSSSLIKSLLVISKHKYYLADRGEYCQLHQLRVSAPCDRFQPRDRPEDFLR